MLGYRYQDYVSLNRDATARFEEFLTKTPPIFVLLALLLVLMLVLFALFDRRRELFVFLVISEMFSGAMWPALDSGSTILRWLVLFLLAAMSFRVRVNPGRPMWVYTIFILFGTGLIPFSHVFLWSLQTSALFFMTILSAITMADSMRTRDDVQKLFFIMLLGAVAWLAMGGMTLPKLIAARGQEHGVRFSGAIVSATLFVITGGLLLPFAVWGSLRQGPLKWRVLCAGLALALVFILFVSGQRTGTFGGLIGCVPMVVRRRRVGIAAVVTICLVLGAVSIKMAQTNRKQIEFIVKRYTDSSTTGRTEIWQKAIKECLHHPLIGTGLGSDRSFAMKYKRPTHNAYLCVWYTSGIFGLSLYLASFAVCLLQALRLMFRGINDVYKDLGALCVGLTLAELAMGMFETTTSPSNVATITLMLVFSAVGRLSIIQREESLAPQQVPSMPYYPYPVVWVPAHLVSPVTGRLLRQ